MVYVEAERNKKHPKPLSEDEALNVKGITTAKLGENSNVWATLPKISGGGTNDSVFAEVQRRVYSLLSKSCKGTKTHSICDKGQGG